MGKKNGRANNPNCCMVQNDFFIAIFPQSGLWKLAQIFCSLRVGYVGSGWVVVGSDVIGWVVTLLSEAEIYK